MSDGTEEALGCVILPLVIFLLGVFVMLCIKGWIWVYGLIF
jgi:hypothetical protein